MITSTLALSDVDDTNLESAVVQITGNYANGEGLLTFVDQNGISGVWNAGSGTMTLTGTATVAQYEAALRSIAYTNSSDNPSTLTRTVAFTVNDGAVDSNTQTRDISIAATNDDPTGSGLPSDITVTEDVSSNVDLSALNLSDLDDNGGNLTVTLSTSTGGDLSASTGGGVTVGGSGTATLTLTGSLADLNTFLDTPANVQYLHDTPHTFGNDADTIQVVVNDGGNTGSGGGTDQTIGAVNVDITAVNDSPTLVTNVGMTLAVAEESRDPETLTGFASESEVEIESEYTFDESGTGELNDDGVGASAVAVPLASRIQPGVGEPPSNDAAGRGVAERTEGELAESDQRLFAYYTTVHDSGNFVLSYSPELEQLERLLVQDLQQAIVWTQWDDLEQQQETPILVYVGAAGAGMSIFSIGYVFWALRGGALMTVFASCLPAWRFIDPIAMLSAYRSVGAASDESLDTLIGAGNKRSR